MELGVAPEAVDEIEEATELMEDETEDDDEEEETDEADALELIMLDVAVLRLPDGSKVGLTGPIGWPTLLRVGRLLRAVEVEALDEGVGTPLVLEAAPVEGVPVDATDEAPGDDG